MNKVSVIDYDAGNTLSVIKALDYLGMKVELTRDPKKLLGSDHIIFPGVGAYFDCMQKLREYNLIDTMHEIADSKIPLLGICLGMQLLFESSEETIGSDNLQQDSVQGLGLLPGHIRRFRSDMGLKIPQIGWNSINISDPLNSKLFTDIKDESFVYFVHSYYLEARDKKDVAATCSYGVTFDCAVEHGNIFGCQFHPEKSGDTGLKILNNFCSI